jgi:hypothetical protein
MRSSNHYYCRDGCNLNWLLSAEIIFPKAGINFIWEIVTKIRRPIPRSYSAPDFFVMPNTASRVSDALKELVKSEMAIWQPRSIDLVRVSICGPKLKNLVGLSTVRGRD